MGGIGQGIPLTQAEELISFVLRILTPPSVQQKSRFKYSSKEVGNVLDIFSAALDAANNDALEGAIRSCWGVSQKIAFKNPMVPGVLIIADVRTKKDPRWLEGVAWYEKVGGGSKSSANEALERLFLYLRQPGSASDTDIVYKLAFDAQKNSLRLMVRHVPKTDYVGVQIQQGIPQCQYVRNSQAFTDSFDKPYVDPRDFGINIHSAQLAIRRLEVVDKEGKRGGMIFPDSAVQRVYFDENTASQTETRWTWPQVALVTGTFSSEQKDLLQSGIQIEDDLQNNTLVVKQATNAKRDHWEGLHIRYGYGYDAMTKSFDAQTLRITMGTGLCTDHVITGISYLFSEWRGDSFQKLHAKIFVKKECVGEAIFVKKDVERTEAELWSSGESIYKAGWLLIYPNLPFLPENRRMWHPSTIQNPLSKIPEGLCVLPMIDESDFAQLATIISRNIPRFTQKLSSLQIGLDALGQRVSLMMQEKEARDDITRHMHTYTRKTMPERLLREARKIRDGFFDDHVRSVFDGNRHRPIPFAHIDEGLLAPEAEARTALQDAEISDRTLYTASTQWLCAHTDEAETTRRALASMRQSVDVFLAWRCRGEAEFFASRTTWQQAHVEVCESQVRALVATRETHLQDQLASEMDLSLATVPMLQEKKHTLRRAVFGFADLHARARIEQEEWTHRAALFFHFQKEIFGPRVMSYVDQVRENQPVWRVLQQLAGMNFDVVGCGSGFRGSAVPNDLDIKVISRIDSDDERMVQALTLLRPLICRAEKRIFLPKLGRVVLELFTQKLPINLVLIFMPNEHLFPPLYNRDVGARFFTHSAKESIRLCMVESDDRIEHHEAFNVVHTQQLNQAKTYDPAALLRVLRDIAVYPLHEKEQRSMPAIKAAAAECMGTEQRQMAIRREIGLFLDEISPKVPQIYQEKFKHLLDSCFTQWWHFPLAGQVVCPIHDRFPCGYQRVIARLSIADREGLLEQNWEELVRTPL